MLFSQIALRKCTIYRCQVHHDSIMNTSDHLSVALDLTIDNVIIAGKIAHDFPDHIA